MHATWDTPHQPVPYTAPPADSFLMPPQNLTPEGLAGMAIIVDF